MASWCLDMAYVSDNLYLLADFTENLTLLQSKDSSSFTPLDDEKIFNVKYMIIIHIILVVWRALLWLVN